jgi:hypothetical protein
VTTASPALLTEVIVRKQDVSFFGREKIGDPGFIWFHLDFFAQDGKAKSCES